MKNNIINELQKDIRYMISFEKRINDKEKELTNYCSD